MPRIEGVEISVAQYHAVTPLFEGESYLGFIFARGAGGGRVQPVRSARQAAVYDRAGDRAGAVSVSRRS